MSPRCIDARAMFLGSSSYMVYRLTGEYVMDYHTASYYNPLFDLRNLRWDARFAEPIVDLDRLPRLLWSDQIAGEVTPSRGCGDRAQGRHPGDRWDDRRGRRGGQRRRHRPRRHDGDVRDDHVLHPRHRRAGA